MAEGISAIKRYITLAAQDQGRWSCKLPMQEPISATYLSLELTLTRYTPTRARNNLKLDVIFKSLLGSLIGVISEGCAERAESQSFERKKKKKKDANHIMMKKSSSKKT